MRLLLACLLCLVSSVAFAQFAPEIPPAQPGGALGARSTMLGFKERAMFGPKLCDWWETIGDARGAQDAASLQQSADNLAMAALQLQLADAAKANAQALQQQAINAEMSADLLFGNGQYWTACWQYGHQAKEAWEECGRMWAKCNGHHQAATDYYQRRQR